MCFSVLIVGVRSQSRSPLSLQQNKAEFLTEMTEVCGVFSSRVSPCGQTSFSAETVLSHIQEMWFVWHNENTTITYNNPCGGQNDGNWIRSPYPSGTTVKNLLYPYDTYTLEDSTMSKYANNQAPYVGCLRGIELPRFGLSFWLRSCQPMPLDLEDPH